MQAQGEAGMAQMRQGLATILAIEQTLSRGLCLVPLAAAAGHIGAVESGLDLVAEALTVLNASERGDLLAEIYRLQGEFLLARAGSDPGTQSKNTAAAEECFHQALTMARRQQARSWELRAAISLSRLWQLQGKGTAARTLLAEIYGWFTEGFETPDLQAAQTMLAQLGG
jgi:predicted ATPase